MNKVWQLQEAKARFSELFNQVWSDGPQRVSRHGKQTVVLLRESEYLSLSKQEPDFIEFLLSAPKVELELERQADFGRKLEL
ncbi:MAG: type II toxin-antitoxin system prevent-host-death family antitoxin [Spirochaetes bacterium]|nr:type II toxin-antitoxin system prevent-host-death family antitoxin [Spirochaetota bacterium]MBU0956726.1 type II toxin-antitoxin system prevent-host-death family antitoxin [Spirochaetota bacterium]